VKTGSRDQILILDPPLLFYPPRLRSNIEALLTLSTVVLLLFDTMSYLLSSILALMVKMILRKVCRCQRDN